MGRQFCRDRTRKFEGRDFGSGRQFGESVIEVGGGEVQRRVEGIIPGQRFQDRDQQSFAEHLQFLVSDGRDLPFFKAAYA